MAESETRVSRETRLLILVISVAVVVLFVLAQFRFPRAEVGLSTVTPAGLDRLAAKSNYDDLASAMQTTMQTVEPSVVVFDLLGTPDGSKQQERRRAQAIRLRGGLALAVQPSGFKVAGSIGGADTPVVRGFDPRGLIVVAMTSQTAGRPATTAADFGGLAYVAVVEPAAGGPTATPMFIGRVDVQYDERWAGDLLIPGGSAVLPVGSCVFQLDGRFVGLVVRAANGVHAIAPAAMLGELLDRIDRGGAEGPR